MAGLKRFLDAQRGQYGKVLEEIRQGKKKTHWMWYFFPQIKGLGYSQMAKYYAIQSIREAEEYMKHKTLAIRLLICCNELMLLPTDNPVKIFGEIDAQKLQSSMTLFYEVSKLPTFMRVLDKYYDGQKCKNTMEILKQMKEEA